MKSLVLLGADVRKNAGDLFLPWVDAERGQFSRAAADLRDFQGWLATQPGELQLRYGTSPSDWLSTLDAGQNPFDTAVLERLRTA